MEEITSEESLSCFDEAQTHEMILNEDASGVDSASSPPKKKMRFMPPVKHNVSESIVTDDMKNLVSNTTDLNIENAKKTIPFAQLSCLDLLLLDFDCTMNVEADCANINFSKTKDFSQFQEVNCSNSESSDIEYGSACLKERVNVPYYDDTKKQDDVSFYDEDKRDNVPLYNEDKKQVDVPFYSEDKKQAGVPFYDEDKKQAHVPFSDEDKKQAHMPLYHENEIHPNVPFYDKDEKQANVPFYNESKEHHNVTFYNGNMSQAVDRYSNDQDAKTQNFNLPFYEPYSLHGISSDKTQSVSAILLSALKMSFGIEDSINFDFKIIEPDCKAHSDNTLQYGGNSLMQMTCKSSYMEDEVLVFQELLTRRETEIIAGEIVQFKINQEQNIIQEMKIEERKSAVQEKLVKTKISIKTNTKNKKKMAVNLDVKQPVKINKCKPKTNKVQLQKEEIKNVAVRHFGSKADKINMEENGKLKKQNMIKMQTVKIINEKQLAPSERRAQICNDGDGKVKIIKFNASLADEINQLRQESNTTSELLKKFTSLSNKCQKPKGAQTKKRKVSKQVNEQKRALEVACEMMKLLRKTGETPYEVSWNEKELIKLFDKFLHYTDIKSSSSVIELLPHFVLMIKCVKDCHAFPFKVKNLVCRVYSHLQAMYGVQEKDKLELKYIAAVKKKGKVQSRKARELINDIRTWDEDLDLKNI